MRLIDVNLRVLAAVALLAVSAVGCGGQGPEAANSAPAPSTEAADPVACPSGLVDYNADAVAEAVGAPTARAAVDAFLERERASITAARSEDVPDGVRYLDAEGRMVAEFFASSYDGSTWIMNRATVCPDNFEREG